MSHTPGEQPPTPDAPDLDLPVTAGDAPPAGEAALPPQPQAPEPEAPEAPRAAGGDRTRRRVLVVGGGVVGLCCALRLARAGQDVTVIDGPAPNGRPPASWGNAGHIAVEQVSPLASFSTLKTLPRRWYGLGGALDVRDLGTVLPWAWKFLTACRPAVFARGRTALTNLLADAIPAWEDLLDAIGEGALLRLDGHLVVWESTGSARRGRRGWGAESGFATLGDLTAADRALLSGLRPLADGLRFAGTGQVSDPGLLLDRLAAALVAAGGRREASRVARLDLDGGAAQVVLADGRRLGGDAVLISAGIGSAALMAGVGERPPLIAERGYHVQWADHDWPEDAPPVVFEDRSMIVTRFDGGLRAASFVEFAREDSLADPGKWDRLRHHVHELGLPVRGPGVEWTGARPTLPDYLPAIGRATTPNNLYYAFGHQHLGLTLAGVTARLVEDLLLRPAPETDRAVAPFSLTRFGDWVA